MTMKSYDILVIGSGSGGLTVAFTAVGFGKKVLLVDQSKPGGECTWSGCVPSKALINEAKKVHHVRKYVPEYEYDTKLALDHVKAVREGIYKHEDPETLEKSGINFAMGKASFISANQVKVGEEIFEAKKIIISTGSSPFIPPIDGLDQVEYLTNETIFELEHLPESMIVLGGGAIGVELSQAMNRLGVKVDLVEMMPTIMFREEKEHVLKLQDILVDEGIDLHLGSKAVHVDEDEDGITLTYEKDGDKHQVKGKTLLVAIGRKPNVDGLNLDEVGIRYERRGITVNDYLQTSLKNVYAIGDVVGPYQFSHMANVQGILAAQNAILPFKRKINYNHTAWVTFTEPELARAGMTEAEAREKYGDRIRVYDYNFNDLDRTRTKGLSPERMKVILNGKGKVLGTSILSDRAGEMIGEIQVLKTLGHNFAKMSKVIHPYPTYSEVFSKIGKKVTVDNLLNHPIVKLFRK
jgi:pyruvate/2-oxoglutarate dehydrogenase complex dihydrolipoamide dehydrogenase (E3) component